MFKLRIITPAKIVFEGDVNSLSLNTDEGEQVILSNHAPYMGKVVHGELRYDDNNEKLPFAVDSGFIQIVDNICTVLIDNATYTKEIDILKAEEARSRAEEFMKDAKDERIIEMLQSEIKLANLHISMANKYKL